MATVQGYEVCSAQDTNRRVGQLAASTASRSVTTSFYARIGLLRPQYDASTSAIILVIMGSGWTAAEDMEASATEGFRRGYHHQCGRRHHHNHQHHCNRYRLPCHRIPPDA